jgi:hypothetical protein
MGKLKEKLAGETKQGRRRDRRGTANWPKKAGNRSRIEKARRSRLQGEDSLQGRPCLRSTGRPVEQAPF